MEGVLLDNAVEGEIDRSQSAIWSLSAGSFRDELIGDE